MTYPESADSLAKRGAKLLGRDYIIIINNNNNNNNIIVIISSAYINKSLSIMSFIHVLKVRIEFQYSR